MKKRKEFLLILSLLIFIWAFTDFPVSAGDCDTDGTSCSGANCSCIGNERASVNLTWDSYPGGCSNYRLLVGTNCSKGLPGSTQKDIGSSSFYAWSDLVHQTNYCWAVVCTDNNGETAIFSFITPDCSWAPSLRVLPDSATVYIGQTQQFTAYYDSDGVGPQAEQNVTTPANWSSANSAIATIDNDANKGLATAKSTGSTIISATYSSLSASGTLIVSNRSPVASAGPDKETFEGQTVVLDGSGSDPDGDSLTFSWSCVGGALSNPNIAQPTYTAPAVVSDTNHTCTLTVADGKGGSSSDAMAVKVKNTTLSVSLIANPDCVNPACRAPVRNVSLTATVLPESTAIGQTANYTFWCHCSYAGSDIATAIAQCGVWSHKADNQNPNSYIAQGICNYLNPAGGSYTPKVIVEKGLAAAAEKRVANFTVLPNNPPQTQDLHMSPSDCTEDCNTCKYPLTPILYWEFKDDSGDYQTAFEIHVADNQNFNNYTNITGGKKPGDTESYTAPSGVFEFGKEYWWRLRVWDGVDVQSTSWAVYGPYKIPAHPYPELDFSWSPQRPNVGKEVQFTDKTKCYNNAGNVVACKSWHWIFQQADPGESDVQNPVTTFSVKPGEKIVTLTVFDNDGFYCDITKKVIAITVLPKWREVIPW